MPEGLWSAIQPVLIVILIVVGLGFLIFIHEAGHFLVAKWKGVRVDAFSLGMGPIIWKRIWRGTEYRISAVPLGGYVKMAGENIGDPHTGAPDELTSKSAFARLQIFAAGALMNLFIAFPLAILACLAGRTEAQAVIGTPSYADTIAKLKPGDHLLSVDGRKVESLDDYKKYMVSSSQGKTVDVRISRDGVEQSIPVTVMESKKHLQSLPPPTTLPRIAAGSPAWNAGLRNMDEVLQINGKEASYDPTEFRETLSKAAIEGAVTLLVRQPEQAPRTVVLKDLKVVTEDLISKDYRLLEPVISEPGKDSPAAQAGLQAGDVILRIGNKPIATFKDLFDEVAAHPGQTLAVQYRRAGSDQTTNVMVMYRSKERGYIGVGPGKTPNIVQVAEEPDSSFYKAGLKSGDVLVTIAGLPNPATANIAAEDRLGSVKVQVRRGQEIQEVTIPALPKKRLDFEAAGFLTDKGTMALAYNRIERRWGLQGAIVTGLHEPVDMIDMTFKILGKLFVREEDPTGLAGPVGIFKASFFHAQAGFGNFLFLLVLITINLGIFNLLPVPVLDGGHILLLAIEKIKGAPPSPRFVERFQLVGLVLLLSLLIFVTVNDLR